MMKQKLLLLVMVTSLNAMYAMAPQQYPIQRELLRRSIEHPNITAFFNALDTDDYQQARDLLAKIRNLTPVIKALKSSDINRLSDLLKFKEQEFNKEADIKPSPYSGEEDITQLQNKLKRRTDELEHVRAEIREKEKNIKSLHMQCKKAGIIPEENDALRKENDDFRGEIEKLQAQIVDIRRQAAQDDRLGKEELQREKTEREFAQKTAQNIVDSLKTVKEQFGQSQNYCKVLIEERDKFKEIIEKFEREGAPADETSARAYEKRIQDLQSALEEQIKIVKRYQEQPTNTFKHIFDKENGVLRRMGRIALGNDRIDSNFSETRRALRTLYYSIASIINDPTNTQIMGQIQPKVNKWFNAGDAMVTDPEIVDPSLPDSIKRQWVEDVAIINKKVWDVRKQMEESRKKQASAMHKKPEKFAMKYDKQVKKVGNEQLS